MASSITFRLGDIIEVHLPENSSDKCFGVTSVPGDIQPCKNPLGKSKKEAARRILRHPVTLGDLNGSLVRDEIKDLAQLLVRCKHKIDRREALQSQWLDLLEKHREAQEAAQVIEQTPARVNTQSPLSAIENTETPAIIETTVRVESSSPDGHISWPALPSTPDIETAIDEISEGHISWPMLRDISEIESVTTQELPERQVFLPPVSPPIYFRDSPETFPGYRPTLFAQRVPTIHDDFPHSLSANWILSFMVCVFMQIGQNMLAMMQIQSGTVSTRDQAGQVTNHPVTHLKFLVGVHFSIERLNVKSVLYGVLVLALFRLAFSVFWPLSGYLVGGFVLLALEGRWNRRLFIE
jgi:hypothetical protein